MTELLCALALTLLIEVPLGALLLKRKDSIIPLILINILTNPALNVILMLLFSLTQSFPLYWTAVTIGEIIVFVCEAFLLRTLCDLTIKRALVLLTIINTCSLLLGSIILALV